MNGPTDQHAHPYEPLNWSRPRGPARRCAVSALSSDLLPTQPRGPSTRWQMRPHSGPLEPPRPPAAPTLTLQYYHCELPRPIHREMYHLYAVYLRRDIITQRAADGRRRRRAWTLSQCQRHWRVRRRVVITRRSRPPLRRCPCLHPARSHHRPHRAPRQSPEPPSSAASRRLTPSSREPTW